MNKYKYILPVSLLMLGSFTSQALAQVTIGSDKTPASYSILQLDGNQGGLRLPQLTEGQKTALGITPAMDKAKGLMIFNVTNNTTEFWDGSKWAKVGDAISVTNGLSNVANGTIRLGGKLDENTVLNLNSKLLSIGVDGKFSINNDMLVVEQRAVDINAPKHVSVNDSTLLADTKLVAANDLTAVVSTNTLSVDRNTSTTSVEGSLVYNSTTGGAPEAGKVLISDKDGNARWADMRASNLDIVYGEITLTEFPTGSTPAPISKVMPLRKGRWLISVSMPAEFVSQATPTSKPMARIYLASKAAGDPEKISAVMASDNDDFWTVGIEMLALLDLDKDSDVYLNGLSSARIRKVVNPDFPIRFVAVLIDDLEN